MLAFKLAKGEHRIELKYTPEGFKAGVAVSLLGLFIFILMILAYWQRKRLLPIWQKATSKVTAKLLTLPSKAPSPIPDATAVADIDDDAPDDNTEDVDPEPIDEENLTDEE